MGYLFEGLPYWNLAEMRPGSQLSGPEALLHDIGYLVEGSLPLPLPSVRGRLAEILPAGAERISAERLHPFDLTHGRNVPYVTQ